MVTNHEPAVAALSFHYFDSFFEKGICPRVRHLLLSSRRRKGFLNGRSLVNPPKIQTLLSELWDVFQAQEFRSDIFFDFPGFLSRFSFPRIPVLI